MDEEVMQASEEVVEPVADEPEASAEEPGVHVADFDGATITPVEEEKAAE